MKPAKESGKKRVHPAWNQTESPETPGDRVSDATASQIEQELRVRSPVKVLEDESGRPIGVTLPTMQNNESSSDPLPEKPAVSPIYSIVNIRSKL